jgi:predicted butyrate kinase (DUF1464 family)
MTAMRVIGIDPGTVSFDICGLQDDEVILDESIASPDLSRDPAPLIEAVKGCMPIDLAVGPSGYGLPLIPGHQVGERELALMMLVRADEASATVGIGGMKSMIRELIATGAPLVFAPGVIHLPTVPAYRKANRIDMGTADKVCSAALAIVEQAQRYGMSYAETSFIMLELGGGFSAALAIDGGKIIDGFGGSSGPLGFRAAGAMDGEVAYLLGSALSKETIFSGGAVDIAGEGAQATAFEAWATHPHYRDGWLAWLESFVKTTSALTAVLPKPREILLSGRLSNSPLVVAALAERLSHIARVRRLQGLTASDGSYLRSKSAAQGAALLANGLAGGRYAPLVEAMELRGASGTALDHLHLRGADTIEIT